MMLPRIAKLYETAGNTLIARIDRSDFDVFGVACDVPGGDNVAYIVACADPERFGRNPGVAWDVETLDFVIGR